MNKGRVASLQIRPLWGDPQEWLTRHVRGNIQLLTEDILFGKVGNNNALINHLILLTTQYIYNSRIAGNGVALNCIVNIFKNIFKVEKLSAKTNMKNDAFVKKMCTFIRFIQYWFMIFSILVNKS